MHKVFFAPYSVNSKEMINQSVIVVRRPRHRNWEQDPCRFDLRLSTLIEAYLANGERCVEGIDQDGQFILGERKAAASEVVWLTCDQRDKYDLATGGKVDQPWSNSTGEVCKYFPTDWEKVEAAIKRMKALLDQTNS